MNDLYNLLSQYPNLAEPKVSLTNLGVGHRVFSNWKEKGLIDYEHVFSEEDISNEVTRKKIELNAFEALWVLIVQELRLFNVGLGTIKQLKSFLFSIPDFDVIKDITQQELDQVIDEGLDFESKILSSRYILNVPELVNDIMDSPERDKMYYCNLGILVNSILISGHSPSVFIHKKPFSDKLDFEIFNSTLESLYFKKTGIDHRAQLSDGLSTHSLINIPLRPLFCQFFEKKSLLRHAQDFDLFTPAELKILKILKDKDFQKIILYKDNSNKIIIESSEKTELFGEKAKKLKTFLGLKEYGRVEVINRNNKHMILNNTTKHKIDLGNP